MQPNATRPTLTTIDADRGRLRPLAAPPPLIGALLTLTCLVVAGSMDAEARNIFYPLNQAVYFAEDRVYPSSDFLPRKNYYYAVIRKRSIFNDNNVNDTNAKKDNSVQQQQSMIPHIDELAAPTAKASAIMPETAVDAAADIATTMAAPLTAAAAQPLTPYVPPQRFAPLFALPFNRPTAQRPAASGAKDVEPVEPLEVVPLTSDFNEDGMFSMVDTQQHQAASTSPSVSIFGPFPSGSGANGCFCCRAFVCHRQRKCPCSKFIF